MSDQSTIVSTNIIIHPSFRVYGSRYKQIHLIQLFFKLLNVLPLHPQAAQSFITFCIQLQAEQSAFLLMYTSVSHALKDTINQYQQIHIYLLQGKKDNFNHLKKERKKEIRSCNLFLKLVMRVCWLLCSLSLCIYSASKLVNVF